jgi:FMN phosphatase YigB (HAD superfamily)
MAASVLLWDFGDTLVDERWMRKSPPSCPEWPNIWMDVMRVHADDWNVGRVTEADIFAALSEQSGLSLTDVERHAQHCCDTIKYNDAAWNLAVSRQRRQAVVTVNPDLFTTRIIGGHRLHDVFDAAVVSADEGTDDKVTLCEIALHRLGFTGDRSEALLIDNRQDLVEAWRRSGGAGYWYQGDALFASDVDHLLS